MSGLRRRQISVESNNFTECVKTFIDQNKPDPLLLKQLECLQFEWDHAVNPIESNVPAEEDCSNTICRDGVLKVIGEYITIIFNVSCWWSHVLDGQYKMNFQLAAGAEFTSKNQWPKLRNKHVQRKEKKGGEQIRRKMQTRFMSDPYIRRILKNEQGDLSALVCDASIKFELGCSRSGEIELKSSSSFNQLEERVCVSEDVLEGIRRGLFSHMDTNILLMEFLLSMPYLPQENADSKNQNILESRLSRRLKLRVLEDVMFDECEKEGEDDLLDDLDISEGRDTERSIEGNTKNNLSSGKRRKS